MIDNGMIDRLIWLSCDQPVNKSVHFPRSKSYCHCRCTIIYTAECNHDYSQLLGLTGITFFMQVITQDLNTLSVLLIITSSILISKLKLVTPSGLLWFHHHKINISTKSILILNSWKTKTNIFKCYCNPFKGKWPEDKSIVTYKQLYSITRLAESSYWYYHTKQAIGLDAITITASESLDPIGPIPNLWTPLHY